MAEAAQRHAGADHDLVDQCVHALQRASGLTVEARGDELHARGHGWQGCFRIEVRPRVSPSMNHVVWELAELAASDKLVLLTRRVSDRMGERLREAGVAYADAAGNAYLADPPTLVLIRGMRPAPGDTGEGRRRAEGRAFATAGLRVVAALLADPRLAAQTYREIAAAAGVSLGAASEAMADLRKRRFLAAGGRGRGLTHVADLHRRWLDGYVDRLRRKLVLGRWRFADPAARPDRLSNAGLPPGLDLQLGGEAAAACLVGHLRPQTASLHVQGRPGAAASARALRLLPDRQGPIVMLDQVAGIPAHDGDDARHDAAALPLAHPLLVHAELAAAPDPDARLREAADLLYRQRLRPAFDRAEGDSHQEERR